MPLIQNINQINEKFVTLIPNQIQTCLNLGQGVQFINDPSNIYNYGNMRYVPNDTIY